MTNPDRAAFNRSILDNPADDTVRLVYADYLDEHGDCADDHARAEFIRLQIDLALIPGLREANAGPGGIEWIRSLVRGAKDTGPDHPALLEDRRLLEEYSRLSDREGRLLNGHEAEWRKGPVCPKCWSTPGCGKGHYNVSNKCGACDGTGDAGGLTSWVLIPGATETKRQPPVEFRCGFPFAVECRLADAFEERDVECPHCIEGPACPETNVVECSRCDSTGVIDTEWVPPELAVRWLTWHPIEEVRFTDVSARYVSDRQGDGWTFSRMRISDADNPHAIPDVLRDRVKDKGDVPGLLPGYFRWREADDARVALWQTAADIIREAAAVRRSGWHAGEGGG